jgi:hypothetical protein
MPEAGCGSVVFVTTELPLCTGPRMGADKLVILATTYRGVCLFISPRKSSGRSIPYSCCTWPTSSSRASES